MKLSSANRPLIVIKRALDAVPAVLFLSVAVAACGCIALDSDRAQHATGDLAEPVLHLSSINEHVSFLSDLDPADEPEAMRYIVDRLREYRIQPGLGERYRTVGESGGLLAVGMVAGRNPAVAEEAVLVSADLHDQVAAAAWLELARVYAAFARSGVLPERSVIFALWTGGERGVRQFVRTPPWMLSEITSWIYLHPPEEQENSLRELAQGHGWRYHLVYSDLTIPGEIQGPVARRLAERAHANIRAEVLSEGSFLPIRPNVLVAPPEDFDPSS